MKAEIITIGDEILIGQIVDTNSAWIAARLNEAGFTVVRKLTVGDDRREIADAVEGAMRTADAVIVTGGLGPTKDDITKQTLAGIFGGEMVRDRETYERNGRILGRTRHRVQRAESGAGDGSLLGRSTSEHARYSTGHVVHPGRQGGRLPAGRSLRDEGADGDGSDAAASRTLPSKQGRTPHCHHLRTGRIGTRGNDSGMGGGSAGYLHLAYLPSPSQIRLRLSAYDIEGRPGRRRKSNGGSKCSNG